jgi:nucleotide-binding universal stress UspA family protein
MGFPFRKILSPVDFNDHSLEALEWAVQIAAQSNGTVCVLHVVPVIIPPTGIPVNLDIYREQEEAARQKLAAITAQRLGKTSHEAIVRLGEPASSILKVQTEIGADLIVIATHGRRGWSRLLLGSVAEMVLRQAACPVFAIPPDAAATHGARLGKVDQP